MPGDREDMTADRSSECENGEVGCLVDARDNGFHIAGVGSHGQAAGPVDDVSRCHHPILRNEESGSRRVPVAGDGVDLGHSRRDRRVDGGEIDVAGRGR